MSNNLDSMQSTVDNRTSLMNGGIADDILQQHRGRGPPGHPPGGGPPSPPQPLLQQQQQHTINEITNKHQVCDSDWGLPQGGGGSSPPGLPHHSNSTSIKDSYKPQPEMSMPPISSALPADLFEEDDLGFDPFHETQKALAEMLESESKVQAELQKQLQEQRQQQQQQIQQQQQQQQNHNNQAQQQPHRHLYQHQASTGQIPNFPNSQNQRLNDDTSPPLQQLRHESPVMNRAPIGTSGIGTSGGSGGGGSSSLMAGLRGFTNDLVQQTSIAGGSGGLPNHMNSASNSTAGGPPGLRKQPPPGFDPLSMLNSGSSNGQHSSQRNLLSPGKKKNSIFFFIKVRKSRKQ